MAAAEGVVALAERIWPALEHIDTSSGALGAAVHRTLIQLLPILLEASGEEATRAAWLERLRKAILDDGVDYLAPVSERFGEIAIFPALQNAHADRDLVLVRSAWSDHARFSHVPTATLTLSCLLEAAESTVNRIVGKPFEKLQQMRWLKRGAAHLMLHPRTSALYRPRRVKFKHWHPALKPPSETAVAA